MLRRRLVRQSALSLPSSSESNSMPSPPPLRRRRNSQDSKMYRQLSSDSLDNLLVSPSTHQSRDARGRRHSVACSVLYTDIQKSSLKSAFNCAVRRMSDACSLLSSAPSSTYNLSSGTQYYSSRKKENEVILPQVLGTFRQSLKPSTQDKTASRNNFQVNRRFSTDCSPPTYTEVTSGWKTAPKQKLLTRQHQVVSSKGSLVALEDDCARQDE